MRKSQIEAKALDAMREAMARGESEYSVLLTGSLAIWQYGKTGGHPTDYNIQARALYENHFVAKDAI